jgi:hypothetical protein
MNPDIFDFVKTKESEFETDEVQLGDNWYWNFRTHVQMIFHLKNGVFFTGENNWLRAFKNIMQPMLNLAYWTEDIEVKDVVFYTDNPNDRALSFIIKKYHDEVYVRENDLDTLFDDVTESDIDYGGALVQKTDKARPEVLQLNTIAFCDQTNIEGGALAFKHYFSPSKLKAMEKVGWGDSKKGANITIDELITLAQDTQGAVGVQAADNKKNKVTSKSIEVYIVRGDMPEAYLYDNNEMDKYCTQVQIVAFYMAKNKKKEGVILYRMKDDGESMMFHTSKPVEGRALGSGTGETLLQPQIWTNFLTIHKMNLLESASKIPLYTDDESYTERNRIQDMENLEVTTIQDGKRIFQVPTAAPSNITLMENSINEWYTHSQNTASANDPILGVEAASGTTFKGQERSVAQGRGIHDRRRGQRAKFIEKMYREWIIPDMVKEILNGTKFLATFTADEMRWISEELATKYVNQRIVDAVISGQEITDEMQTNMTALFKESFFKKGNKHMLEILKEDFVDVEISMGINIANKQKDIGMMSDKLLSIFQYIFANPGGFQQAMQIPALARSFQDILEYSGLNQSDFQSLTAPMNSPINTQPDPNAPTSTPAPTSMMPAPAVPA